MLGTSVGPETPGKVPETSTSNDATEKIKKNHTQLIEQKGSDKSTTNDDPGCKTKGTAQSANKSSSVSENFVTSKDTVSTEIWYMMSSGKYPEKDGNKLGLSTAKLRLSCASCLGLDKALG